MKREKKELLLVQEQLRYAAAKSGGDAANPSLLGRRRAPPDAKMGAPFAAISKKGLSSASGRIQRPSAVVNSEAAGEEAAQQPPPTVSGEGPAIWYALAASASSGSTRGAGSAAAAGGSGIRIGVAAMASGASGSRRAAARQSGADEAQKEGAPPPTREDTALEAYPLGAQESRWRGRFGLSTMTRNAALKRLSEKDEASA